MPVVGFAFPATVAKICDQVLGAPRPTRPDALAPCARASAGQRSGVA